MKTLCNFFSVLFLSLFIFSCQTEVESKEPKVDDSRPSNTITYKEMASMFHQYDVGQKPVLDQYRKEFTGDAKDATESISHFYELNQLKQYIAYLEKLSNEKNIKLTGIRIFSAAYPKDHSDELLRGRQTLIFMPTADTDKSKNVAFEPLYSKEGQAVPFTEFLHQFSSDETKNVVRASFLPFMSAKADFNSSGANRLSVMPPY
ncbi:hypothetical protein [Polaribacter sp. L3A8]|uniref:hypothetical protein n=1 Tax=Polaribacter sp. L3A8 TaxID=2686361 RepID=UPI00131B60E7|nr:hypothetical protein [Polaribacter sp. L3A8]